MYDMIFQTYSRTGTDLTRSVLWGKVLKFDNTESRVSRDVLLSQREDFNGPVKPNLGIQYQNRTVVRLGSCLFVPAGC